jgi:tRNA threonylcarbamoyladenosine biosynthesis protein TsaB
MLTLAIECATATIGLALLDEEDIRAELYLHSEKHHSEVLLAALDQLFALSGKTPEEVGLLACSVGPGSFTGLRIGVSTVKGLALSMSIPVVGVSTLEALAMNAVATSGPICPLLDAGNHQVYAGLYRVGAGGIPCEMKPEALVDITRFLDELDGTGIVFLGDGAVRYGELIGKSRRGALCDEGRHRLLGSAVGLVGLRKYRGGSVLDALSLMPRYLRPSKAEMNRPPAD